MVSINTFNYIERADRLNQSVDYAIRDLLNGHSDPLSLAFYLYVFTKHNISSINADKLADWGIAWIRKVFLDGEIGKRRDEEIASAALAVISLNENSSFKVIKNEVLENFHKVLSKEIKSDKIPFRSAPYGSIVLLAANSLLIVDSNIEQLSHKVGKSFLDTIIGGRDFGLIFGINLLLQVKDLESATNIKELAVTSLNKPNTTYEDQIYLLQGLWIFNSESSPDFNLMEVTEHVLKKSPVWQYLMNGIEDISPAGDGQAIIHVSHLLRASLVDVLNNYQVNLEKFNHRKFDARYGVRAGVSWSAFGFYILVLLIMWGGLLYPLIKYSNEAFHYWILNEFASMPKTGAALYLFLGVNLLVYLAILTFRIVPTLYKIFVKSQLGSDQRIKELLLVQFKSSTKIWIAFIVIEILIALFTNIIVPSIQDMLGKP